MGYTPQSLPGKKLLDDLDSTGHGSFKQIRGYESMIAGASAGLISSIITCPLDVVKTTLQAQGAMIASTSSAPASADAYDGILSTFSRIWRHEGFRGLYRGLGPTIYGYLPTWGIYFTVYDRAKVKLSRHISGDDYLVGQDWTSHMLAAMAAGATGTICTNPLWVIKTRFMTQRIDSPQERYKNTLDAIRRIYASEGFSGFYRGLVPSLFGVTHVAVQFPLYERFKMFARTSPDEDLPARKILLCSSVSKMIASLATYPHEVLRTRLQVQQMPPLPAPSAPTSTSPTPSSTQTAPVSRNTHHNNRPSTPSSLHHRNSPPKSSSSFISRHIPSFAAVSSTSTSPPELSPTQKLGVIEIFKSIWRLEGIRGFYRGLSVNFLRTVPSNALTILTYEVVMRRLCRLSGNDQARRK